MKLNTIHLDADLSCLSQVATAKEKDQMTESTWQHVATLYTNQPEKATKGEGELLVNQNQSARQSIAINTSK